MKVFVFYGKIEKENSTMKFMINALLDELVSQTNEKVVISNLSESDFDIKYCNGCSDCFLKGSCPLVDDMEKIKLGILSSDIILFGSPVYGHAVSGSVKTFFDRITYWTHLFKLSGKFGISLDVSSGNGNEPVKQYMEKIMGNLGLSLVSQISIKSSSYSKEIMLNIAKNEMKKLLITYQNNKYKVSATQETSFKNFQRLYKKGAGTSFEREYWLSNGMFEVKTLEEYVNSKSIKL